MPEPDYISKVYSLLSENFSDFKRTEDEFRNKLINEPDYKTKVYGLINDNFSDFNRTEDDFYSKLNLEGLKKKGSSVSSDTKSPYQKPVDVSQATPYGMPKETQIPFVSQNQPTTKADEISQLSPKTGISDNQGRVMPQPELTGAIGADGEIVSPKGTTQQTKFIEGVDAQGVPFKAPIFGANDKLEAEKIFKTKGAEVASEYMQSKGLDRQRASEMLINIESDFAAEKIKKDLWGDDGEGISELSPEFEEINKKRLRQEGYSQEAVEIAWANTKQEAERNKSERVFDEYSQLYGSESKLNLVLFSKWAVNNKNDINKARTNVRYDELLKKGEELTPKEKDEFVKLTEDIQKFALDKTQLYDPISGEKLTGQAEQEYAQQINLAKEELSERATTKELLTKEWQLAGVTLLNAQKELLEYSNKQKQLAGQPIIGDYEYVNKKIFSLQQKIREADKYFNAASQMLLLNESPLAVKTGFWRDTKESLNSLVVSAASTILGKEVEKQVSAVLPVTSREHLQAMEQIGDRAGVEWSEEEKEKFITPLSTEIINGVSGVIGLLPSLAFLNKAAGVAGVAKIIAQIKNPLYKHLAGMVFEEVKMATVGFEPGAGAGFYVGGFIAPKGFLKMLPRYAGVQKMLETTIKTSITGTAGMQIAQPLEKSIDIAYGNLFKNEFKDWDYEFKQMYPDLSEAGRGILRDFAINAALGLFHGLPQLTSTKSPEKYMSLAREARQKAAELRKVDREALSGKKVVENLDAKTLELAEAAVLKLDAEIAKYEGLAEAAEQRAIVQAGIDHLGYNTLNKIVEDQYKRKTRRTPKDADLIPIEQLLSKKTIDILNNQNGASKTELKEAIRNVYQAIERLQYMVNKGINKGIGRVRLADTYIDTQKSLKDLVMNGERTAKIATSGVTGRYVEKVKPTTKVKQSEPLSPKYEIEGKEYSKEEFKTEINRRKEAGEDIKDINVENDAETQKQVEEIFKPVSEEIITPLQDGKIEFKNEGKADKPTNTTVTERLGMNNPFYQKVENALVKLGLIEKWNPETKTGDIVGGIVLSDGEGGFASGKMFFKADGSIFYADSRGIVYFDKNGNIISENVREEAEKNQKINIESKKQSIANFEKLRDSEDFKYKKVIKSDGLGNKKEVKRLKTQQELKESTEKINAIIEKNKLELKTLEGKGINKVTAEIPKETQAADVTADVNKKAKEITAISELIKDGQQENASFEQRQIAEKLENNPIEEGRKLFQKQLDYYNERLLQYPDDAAYKSEVKRTEKILAEIEAVSKTKPEKEKSEVLPETEALKDVESTSKALDKVADSDYNILTELKQPNITKEVKKAEQLNDSGGMSDNLYEKILHEIYQKYKTESELTISEAYHKAKADGSNPELVKAVENLLKTEAKPEIKPEGEVKTEKIEPVEPIKPKSNENITTEENPIAEPTVKTIDSKTKTARTIEEVEGATAEADRLIAESGANVGRLPINNIVVAPKVMQFKAADTKAGTNVNERIPDTEKYSESSAGVILVWKDAKNELGFGKDAIILVDGHHRMDFAKRKGQSEMNVLFVEANTAKEARLEGAFANIRQGRGTAIDAAKIYREASPEQIKTFKPTSLVARQGQQLANLAPELFELLTTGKLDIQRALAISEVKNTKDQVGLYRMVTSRKKKLTIDGIKAMANEINEGNVPKKKNVEETLFGTNETEQILLIEKANLIGKIKSELAKDAKILASANKNKEVLEKAGNIIAVEENVQLSQEAKVASGLFEIFKNRKSVQDILTKATEDLSKAKESEKKAIREKALKKVKQAINKELDSTMGKKEVSKDKKADKTKVEKTEPLSETELANRRKAEKEYNTELEDLDTRIKQAERSKQLKLDDLNKKVDLFAGEGEIAEKGGGLFELPKKQQSPEDIAKILEPYTKEIERLKTKRQELINNKEKYLDKYKGQLETPDVTKTTTELGASNKRSFSNKTEPVTTKGKVKTFAEMAKSFIDGIKKPVRYIKPKRARTIGAYNPTNGLIVMKKANDILTLIHEAAHWLDDYYTLFKNNDKFDSELSKYWDRGSKPPANYPEAERYKRNEGFAEFMVDYIMRPEQTKKESPMLYQLFENTFKDVHKKAIEQLSIDVRNFANLPAIERIGANVQKIEPLSTSKKIKEKVKDFFNKEKFTTRWLNQFYPVEQAFKSLLEVNGISKIYGKKNFEAMLKSFLGRDETFYKSLTKYGILGKNLKPAKDANGNPYTLNSLLDILTDNGKAGENVLNERLQIANNVQIAKRTVEIEGKLRQKQIIEDILSKENKLPPDNLITPEIASEYSKEIADKKAKNATTYTNKRYDFTEAVISGTGGGIFKDYSEAKLALNEFELMKNTNPELFDIINKFNERKKEMSSLLLDYMVETELLTKEQAKAIKDNNLEYISFKRLKESEVGVIEEASLVSGSNPITSVKDIIKAVKGGSSTIQDPIASFIIDYHNVITQGAKNTMLRTITDLADNMRDMYEGKPSLISDILFEVPKGTKGAIRVVKNGEGKYYKFEKSIEESIETLSNMGYSLPGIITFMPSLLRTAVTTAPQFLVRNITRDNAERLFGSTEGKFKIPKNLKRAKQEYLLAGGGQFGYYAKNRADYEAILSNAIKDIAKDNRNVFIKTSLLIPKNVSKFYNYLRTNSETFTRVLEYDSNYKKFKDMGLSDVDAQLEAMAAGRRMMDFKVGGTHAKIVNQMLPFFNPSIQGTRRFYDRITKDPLKVVTRMLVYGGLFELAQAGIIKMSDDDKQKEYFGLSPYRKLLFYNIPLGDGWLIIPKGFTFGMITSNIGRSLDRYWLGDKNAFDLDYLTKQIKLLNPVNSELITGIQNTFSGINSNYDAFRGKNIIPAYEKNKAVELRKGTEKASELSKFISKIFTKIDPRMTDYFIKSSLSYWGDMATSLSNIGTDKEKSLYPMTGFYKEKSIYSNQDVMYVLNTAEKFEQTADNNYKTLVEKIELYNESKSKYTKKDLFNKIIREAKTIREKWEGVDLLEKRKREKGKRKKKGLPQ